VGIAAEYLFLGGLFEKLGVDVEYERVGEYKSAVESYAESKMSDANREQTNALLDSIEGASSQTRRRGASEDQVRLAIDRCRDAGTARMAWWHRRLTSGRGRASTPVEAEYAGSSGA
jgi:hypothetical protein